MPDTENPFGGAPFGDAPFGPRPADTSFALLLDPASLVYAGQSITFNNTLAVASASLAVAGQNIVLHTGDVLVVDAASLAVQGQSVFEDEFLIISPASLAVAGQELILYAQNRTRTVDTDTDGRRAISMVS